MMAQNGSMPSIVGWRYNLAYPSLNASPPFAPTPAHMSRSPIVFLAAAATLSGCFSTRSVQRTDLSKPLDTRVVTHVVTHDAKLIGTAVGGVRVSIRDVVTGKILADGIQNGGTGDTKRIMQDTRKRGDTIFTAADGARYEASVSIATPTYVDVLAEGPLGYPDQLVRASKRVLLLPGRNIGGDGIVLEMNGYIIDLMGPDTTQALPASSPLQVRARVRMLCSCPTQPGGMWEVHDVVARLVRDNKVVSQTTLAYAGETSVYNGELARVEPGVYQLEVIAANAGAATFGIVKRRVTIGR